MWTCYPHAAPGYEFELNERGGYTDWYRCVGGRLADGRWPEWNYRTGAIRYR